MKLIFLTLFVFLFQSISAFASEMVFLDNGALPQGDLWASMYVDAAEVETSLNSGDGKYTLIYKRKGGSSQQTLVVRTSDQKVMGIWSAPNHATYLEGEIFAFNLGRLLGHSEWVTPATRMFLSGPGMDIASEAYNPGDTPKARRCNRDHFNQFIGLGNSFVPGAYMSFVDGLAPAAVPNIVNRKKQKGFNDNHMVVKFVTGVKEPSNDPVYLDLAKDEIVSSQPSGDYRVATEIDVARQLSFMALVDSLNSQRDRFGPYGSNMEAMMQTDGDAFAISAVDNGGLDRAAKTSSLRALLGQYGRPIVKFEEEVVDRVLAINEFVQSNAASPLIIDGKTFVTLDELRNALGIATVEGAQVKIKSQMSCGWGGYMWLYDWNSMTNTRWKKFKEGLAIVSKHINQSVKKHGYLNGPTPLD